MDKALLFIHEIIKHRNLNQSHSLYFHKVVINSRLLISQKLISYPMTNISINRS